MERNCERSACSILARMNATRRMLGPPILAAVLAGACAAPPPPPPQLAGPAEWLARIDLAETNCEAIAASFRNEGERRHENGRITADGRLSEDVFLRHLPGRQPTQTVWISSNLDSAWVAARLVGQVRRDIGFAASCSGGWHLFTETRSGEYVGDGLEEEHFQQLSWFRLDRDGRLVARVQTDARYRGDYQEVSAESTEFWFRFEPSESD